jgi:hypothetical protein
MKLTTIISSVVAMLGITAGSIAWAAPPAGSTGECKDGSYTSAEHKRGACKGHGGVKDWYEADKTTESKAAKESKSTEKKSSTAAAPAAAAPAAAPAATTKTASKTQPGMRAEAAPGGGAGRVWLNTSSNVYHCSGDEWYGKTKAGEYMSESEAKAKGAHASHGKACS